MLSSRIVMDVAAFPMLIFNPLILLLLAMVVGLLVWGIIACIKNRKKTEKELEEKIIYEENTINKE